MHEQPKLTVRYISTSRPACTECQQPRHPSITCAEAAAQRQALAAFFTSRAQDALQDWDAGPTFTNLPPFTTN